MIATYQPHENQRPEVVEVDATRLQTLLNRTSQSLSKEDHELFAAIVDSYQYLSTVIADKETTIAKLRKLMFGSRSEKYQDVVGSASDRQTDAEKEQFGERTGLFTSGLVSTRDDQPPHVAATMRICTLTESTP